MDADLPDSNIEITFGRLAAQWRRECPRHQSRVDRLTGTPAYREIIALGWPVVPCILRELSREVDLWFTALHKITGANPVPSESRGRMSEMAAAWIEWGQREGLMMTKDQR